MALSAQDQAAVLAAAQAGGDTAAQGAQIIQQANQAGLTGTITNPNNGQVVAQMAPDPTPPATISSTSLTPTPTQNYQQPGTISPYPVSTLQAPAPMTMTGPEQQAQDLTGQLQDLYNQDTGQSAYRTQEESAYNVPELTKTYNDLNSQLTGLKNEAAAIPLQLQQGATDRGVTTPLLGAQENSRLRTNAIAALGVSTLLNAAQGNLSYANTLVDKAVEQKYAPIEEQIKARTANLQLILNSPAYSLADKNRAQAQLQIQQQNALALEQQKTNTQQTWSVATQAASNGQNFQPTAQYSSLALALKAISEATSPQQALQIAASTNLVQTQTAANGTKVLGSASTGYFTYDPATGKTSPLSVSSSGTSALGTYKSGMLTTLLQSQGKTANATTLSNLWSQYGTGGTYTNDLSHNAIIYNAMGGTYPTGSTSTSSTPGSLSTISSTQVTALKNALTASKFQGTEADGKYADPNLYLANYNSWVQAGGDPSVFFKYFPPSTYINPANTFLPEEIMKFVR